MSIEAELEIANQTLQTLIECQQVVEGLREELDLSTAILNAIGALVMVLDRQGYIVRYNRVYERTVGYTLDEVKNKPFWELFLLPNEKESAKTRFRQLQIDQLSGTYETDWITKDGSYLRIAWSYTPFLGADGACKYVIGTGTDITQLKRAEQLARGQTKALTRTLNTLMTNPELDQFLGQVLLVIAEQLDVPTIAFWLHDRSHDTLFFDRVYHRGHVFSGTELGHPSALVPVPSGALPIWDEMQRTRGPVVAENARYDPRLSLYHQKLAELGLQTVLHVPLLLKEEGLGYFAIGTSRRRQYSPEELEFVQTLTHQATLAVQLTGLVEQSRQTAVLEERNRIAREIHDTLAQAFTGIVVHQEAAKRILKAQEDVQEHIEWTLELAREGLEEARRSVWALRSQALIRCSLPDTLARLVEQMTSPLAVEALFSLHGTPRPLPQDMESDLLRIAQEALTNVLKHALAQHIHIELIFETHQVRLRVQDDGQGFVYQPASATESLTEAGFGLIGMQERTEHLGGQLTVTSQVAKGTEVVVSIPLSKS